MSLLLVLTLLGRCQGMKRQWLLLSGFRSVSTPNDRYCIQDTYTSVQNYIPTLLELQNTCREKLVDQ